MPRYRVTSPEGKTFEVTAPEGASQDEVLAYAKANMPKGPSMADDFVRPVKGAWDKLKGDVSDDYARHVRVMKQEPLERNFFKESADDMRRTSRFMGDVFGLATSPIAGAVEATVSRPAARALNKLPIRPYKQDNMFAKPRALYGQEAEDYLAGQINTAVSGARAPGPLTKPTPFTAAPKPTPPAPRMKPADLKPAKQAAYEAVDQMGVKYKSSTFDGLVNVIETEMKGAKYNPRLHQGPRGVLSELKAMKGQEPTLTELDQLRQYVRENAVTGKSPGEQRIGNLIIRQIDDFINVAGPKQVLAGDPKAAAAGIKNARDLNTRFRKVEDVEGAVESARLRAGSTGSGGNVDNATRQNLRKVLEDGTWTPEEAKALEEVVMGGKAQNMLRLIGKLSPNGNGMMTALNIGGAAANPLLAIPGMAGVFAKMGADAMTARKVAKLLDLIANGAPAASAKTPFRAPNLRPAGATAATNYFARQETKEPVRAGR